MGINAFYLVFVFIIFRFPASQSSEKTIVIVLTRYMLTFLSLTLAFNNETKWVILSLLLCCLTIDTIALTCCKDNHLIKVLSAILCGMAIWSIVYALELDLNNTLMKSAIFPVIERIWSINEAAIGKWLKKLVGAYYTMFVVNDFVLFVLGCSKKSETPSEKADNSESLIRMGKWIGPFERIIMYILIATSNLNAIGFVIAAKALARFKEFDNKDFAEYFLVGTLSSVAGTLVIGFLFN